MACAACAPFPESAAELHWDVGCGEDGQGSVWMTDELFQWFKASCSIRVYTEARWAEIEQTLEAVRTELVALDKTRDKMCKQPFPWAKTSYSSALDGFEHVAVGESWLQLVHRPGESPAFEIVAMGICPPTDAPPSLLQSYSAAHHALADAANVRYKPQPSELPLAAHVGGASKGLYGESAIPNRGGKKVQDGIAFQWGSHRRNVRHPRERVERCREVWPDRYNPSGQRDKAVEQVIGQHSLALESLESVLSPRCGSARSTIADRFDPQKEYRIIPKDVTALKPTSSFSLALYAGYVISPHTDSDLLLETIGFHWPTEQKFPAGHVWRFVAGGIVQTLPDSPDRSVFICVKGDGCPHGTLPTGVNGETHIHGHAGVSTTICLGHSMIEALSNGGRWPTKEELKAASAAYSQAQVDPLHNNNGKYLVDDELNVVFTPTIADVLHDFRALCRTSSDEMVSFGAFTDRGTGCPMPKPLFSYRRLQRGQLLSEFFHYRHRLASTAKGKPSANELLRKWKRDPKGLERSLERGLERVQGKTVAAKRYWLLSKDSGLYTCTHFRAIVSFDLCNVMYARKVLDACGGWGDRLTGFLASASVEDIVIVEPRAGSIQGYERQVGLVRPAKSVKTMCGTAEAMLPTLTEPFDLIITSPPYWNLETYRDADGFDDGNEVAHHPTLDAFKTTMLQPMLQQMARLLREGGLLAINVDDNPKQGVFLCQFTLDTLRKAGLTFVCTAGLSKPVKFEKGATGARAEPIYLFTKGPTPTYCGTDIIPVRFDSLYGTSLLGKRLRI